MQRKSFLDAVAQRKEALRERLAGDRRSAPDSGYTWLEWGMTCWAVGLLGYASRLCAASLLHLSTRLDPSYVGAFALCSLAFAWPLRGRVWAPHSCAAGVAKRVLRGSAAVFVVAALGLITVLAIPLSGSPCIFDALAVAAIAAGNCAVFAMVAPLGLKALRSG